MKPLGHVALIPIAATLLSTAGLAPQRSLARDGRPNVVLIITDDQGWGDIHSHGNDLIDTPVMDRLGADGARFDRFFVSPVCAPTRASLLSGRDHLRTGTTWVTHRWEVMRAEETTIAEVLKAAGYATGCFGKWHNGMQFPNHPNGQGFDEFFGFCGGAWNEYFDATLEHNGQEVLTAGYITDSITDAAIEFLEENRADPFFCYVPYNAPHSPYVVSDAYFQKYKSRGLDDKNAAIYGMIESIDANIGRILERIDELSLTDDTIILFLTDNGPNGKRYNGSMKGTKGSVHEGGVRVPLFIRWPGRIKPGTTVTRIAQHIDLLPTIVELCGAKMPRTLPLDGVSLVPLLQGKTSNWPDRMLFTHQTRRGQVEPVPAAVRTDRYRLVNTGKRWELYDVTADPRQENDIAASRSEVVDRLRAGYEKWFAEISSPGFQRPPIPLGHPQSKLVTLPPSAAYLSGELSFANSIGWTTDWIANWKSTDDRIAWDLDVAAAGRYEVTLMYAAGPDDVGSAVRVSAGGQSAEGTVSAIFDTGRIRRPDRVADPAWWLREFAPCELGEIKLPQGPVRLELRALSVPGTKVCDLGGLLLRRVD